MRDEDILEEIIEEAEDRVTKCFSHDLFDKTFNCLLECAKIAPDAAESSKDVYDKEDHGFSDSIGYRIHSAMQRVIGLVETKPIREGKAGVKWRQRLDYAKTVRELDCCDIRECLWEECMNEQEDGNMAPSLETNFMESTSKVKSNKRVRLE
jgi:hypothetical protein